jgi:N-acetylneuraminic acid mutarotase
VEVYDPSTNLWSSAPPIHRARAGLAAGVLNGKIYAIGGYVPFGTGIQVLNTVEVFDPSTNLWSAALSPLLARAGHAVATVNGFIYVIGGETSNETPLLTVEQYSPPVILYTFTKN